MGIFRVFYIWKKNFTKICLVSDCMINIPLNNVKNEMNGIIGYGTVPCQM